MRSSKMHASTLGRHQAHRSRVFPAVMPAAYSLTYAIMYNYYINNNLNHYLNCLDRARVCTALRIGPKNGYSGGIIMRAYAENVAVVHIVSPPPSPPMFIAVFSYGNTCANQITRILAGADVSFRFSAQVSRCKVQRGSLSTNAPTIFGIVSRTRSRCAISVQISRMAFS